MWEKQEQVIHLAEMKKCVFTDVRETRTSYTPSRWRNVCLQMWEKQEQVIHLADEEMCVYRCERNKNKLYT